MRKALAIVVLLALAGASQAQGMRSFLVAQYFENGSQMCRYDNGTVLNVGARICPLSIPA
jgi:hypothetical protein